ncbi:MAG TPA: ion channel [Fluviicola sp.]|nr:ion channel [Fluviicola sp.]
MKQTKDPGLGTTFNKSVKRMLNEDGGFNIKRIGTVSTFRDFYKYLIDLPTFKFMAFIFLFFIGMNLIFALGYVAIGVDQLSGVPPKQPALVSAFYFSTQTFTTVGYGAIAPKGNGASLLASFEAFFGLISFSIATGLIYGRFSRPSAKIAFSHNVIITPHEDKRAMMFKMVNKRNSVLLNCKVNITLSIAHRDRKDGHMVRQYYNIPLETDFVRYFPLTWTLVHIIDEQSPLHNLDIEQLQSRTSELLILVEAFDETYSQMVLQKHSYADHQWVENVKFKRNFHANESGQIVLNIHELSELEEL